MKKSSPNEEAARDGRIFADIAKNRVTPAHDTLTAVYAGLYYHHLPGNVDEFKKKFYKNLNNDC